MLRGSFAAGRDSSEKGIRYEGSEVNLYDLTLVYWPVYIACGISYAVGVVIGWFARSTRGPR